MAEQRIQKTLEIRAEYSQALEGIAKYRAELDRAKAEAKLMTEELKNHAKQLNKGEISEEQYAKAVMETQKQLAANKQEQTQLADAIRTSERVIQNQITQQNEAQDSIKAMRAQLSNLTREYDGLSGAQRNNEAVGGALLNRINDVTDQIKEAEEATQRYQRNVGNYTNSIVEAMEKLGIKSDIAITNIVSTGNSTVDAFINMATGAEGLKGALNAAGLATKGLIKQLVALIATPVGIVLAAIAAGYYAVKTAIDKSEESNRSWQKSMAPLKSGLQVFENRRVATGQAIINMLQPIMNLIARIGALYDALVNASGGFDIIKNVTTGAFNVVGKFFNMIDSGIKTILKYAEAIPGLGDKIKEANKRLSENVKITEQKIAMEDADRKMLLKESEVEMKVSGLRAKAAQKDKYNVAERKKYLEEAIALEKKLAEDRKKMAENKFALMKREAALASNSKADNDALAEAQAEVNREVTAYNNKMMELNAQLAEFSDQQKAEREKKKALLKEQQDTEEQLWREYEDTLLVLVKESYEKQKQVVATNYQREIEDLQKRLDEEENLTKSARDAIN